MRGAGGCGRAARDRWAMLWRMSKLDERIPLAA
jgi:hypothetical protein